MHLLLAISRHVPESVSPALANSGDWNRHRTWYQWVRGSVGAVDNHTVILPRRIRHEFDWAGATTLCTRSSPQMSTLSDRSSGALELRQAGHPGSPSHMPTHTHNKETTVTGCSFTLTVKDSHSEQVDTLPLHNSLWLRASSHCLLGGTGEPGGVVLPSQPPVSIQTSQAGVHNCREVPGAGDSMLCSVELTWSQ